MITLQRISYVDRKGFLYHEWFPTPMTAGDRVKELDTLGMESIDMEDVDVPWDDHAADLIRWLNFTPNSPNLKEDTMMAPQKPLIDVAEGLGDPIIVGFVPPTSALDRQEGGSHYKDLAIQPVEYIHANSIPFVEGCVIKYVSRWRSKGGIKDLGKARHFLDMLIELESRKEGT